MRLKDLLDYADMGNDDIQVRFVSQPDRHALVYHIREVDIVNGVLYLSEGSQIGYADADVADRFSR